MTASSHQYAAALSAAGLSAAEADPYETGHPCSIACTKRLPKGFKGYFLDNQEKY